MEILIPIVSIIIIVALYLILRNHGKGDGIPAGGSTQHPTNNKPNNGKDKQQNINSI